MVLVSSFGRNDGFGWMVEYAMTTVNSRFLPHLTSLRVRNDTKGQAAAIARTSGKSRNKRAGNGKSKNEVQAAAKATAGPFGKLRAGSSTASFAKCANDVAQEDPVF
jgi:hypothetical protein